MILFYFRLSLSPITGYRPHKKNISWDKGYPIVIFQGVATNSQNQPTVFRQLTNSLLTQIDPKKASADELREAFCRFLFAILFQFTFYDIFSCLVSTMFPSGTLTLLFQTVLKPNFFSCTGTSTRSALSLHKHPNSLPQLHRSDQPDKKLFFTIFPLKFNLPPGEWQRPIKVHYCGQFLSKTLGDTSACSPRRKARPWIL